MNAATRRVEVSASNIANVASTGTLPDADGNVPAGAPRAYAPLEVTQTAGAGGTQTAVKAATPSTIAVSDRGLFRQPERPRRRPQCRPLPGADRPADRQLQFCRQCDGDDGGRPHDQGTAQHHRVRPYRGRSRAARPAVFGLAPFHYPLSSSSMKLVFLHGSPAVGKLTVANALLRRIVGQPVRRHAAIDLARTVFEFGAPGLPGPGA